MDTETKKPIEDVEKDRVRKEIVKLIDQYLAESEQAGCGEGIANDVYSLFSYNGIKSGLYTYSNAAASVLSVFATNKKICEEIEAFFGDNFYYVCQMLQKLIEFCNNIQFSEANLARLDKSRWEYWGDITDLSIEELLKEKRRYEGMLQHLKEQPEK